MDWCNKALHLKHFLRDELGWVSVEVSVTKLHKTGISGGAEKWTGVRRPCPTVADAMSDTVTVTSGTLLADATAGTLTPPQCSPSFSCSPRGPRALGGTLHWMSALRFSSLT